MLKKLRNRSRLFQGAVSAALVIVLGIVVLTVIEHHHSRTYTFTFRTPLSQKIRDRFRLEKKPDIISVHLAGQFNGWNPADSKYLMQKINARTWKLRISLAPGSYQYKFCLRIEGRKKILWLPDPGNPKRAPDHMGGWNSVYNRDTVLGLRRFLFALLAVWLLLFGAVRLIRRYKAGMERLRKRRPQLFKERSLRRRLLMRAGFLLLLAAVFFPIDSYNRKQAKISRIAHFRFRLPFPDAIRKKYGIQAAIPIKRVVLTGSFSSWNAESKQYRMQKSGSGEWHLSLPLKEGEYEYKFVIYPDAGARWKNVDNGRIWCHDGFNKMKTSDGFQGFNSLKRVGAYRGQRRYFRIIIIGLAVGIVLLTLLEFLLKLLMHIRISLRSKLVVVFLIFLVLSNFLFIINARVQQVETIQRGKVNEINLLHALLLAGGADFTRLDDAKMIKTISDRLNVFFSRTQRRFDYRVYSPVQSEIDGVYLYNPKGKLLLFSENSALLQDNINIAGSAEQLFRNYSIRGREIHRHFASLIGGERKAFFFRDRDISSSIFRIGAGYTFFRRLLGGFDYSSFYYPIYTGNLFRGYYLIGMQTMGTRIALTDNMYFNISLVLFVALFLFILIRKLGINILNPLNRLVQGMTRVREGDLDYRMDIASRDELEDLGNAYNFMTGELIVSRKQNEDYSRNLESKVESRTRELQEANDRLKELDRLKTEFFANISHELRTPLTLLLAPLESMLAGELGELPQRVGAFHNTMHANSMRLLRLINNLLDFSKLEAGRFSLQYERLNVTRALDFMVNTLQSAAETRGLNLGFIRGKEELYLFQDRQAFEKIVMNLLSNAFKFTQSGGSITVSLHRDGEEVLIRIEDTGIGIPADKQEHVFERFSQVDGGEKREYEGTGIGLSLVRELVEAQHGTIALESESGMGSAFTLVFPEGRNHLDDEEVKEASEEPFEIRGYNLVDFLSVREKSAPEPKTIKTGDDGRILVIDDNPDMREFIVFLLQDVYQLEQAVDGAEGLKKMRSFNPDLVISDVMMPNMSGYELCGVMKKDPVLRHTPVILLTARADMAQKIEGLSYGADDYLSKPFNSKELLVRVENLLRSRQLQRELAREKEIQDLDFMQAASVQRSILSPPAVYRAFDGVEVAVSFQPMNGAVSGDYYHFKQKPDGAVSVLIADATGHGVQAALTTMQIDVLNNESFRYKYPDERLEFINSRFSGDLSSKNFFTAFLVDLYPDKIRYSGAAHPAQYLLRPASGEVIPLQTRGRLMGLLEDSSYEMEEQKFMPGDILVLFSDGVTEEFDPDREEYGEERLLEHLKELIADSGAEAGMEVFNKKILDSIDTFRGSVSVNDDITLISIRKK